MCVLSTVTSRMLITVLYFDQLVMKVFTAETASKFVPLIVRYVDARTDCAPVRQDGPVQDVLKVIVSYLTEKYWQHKKKDLCLLCWRNLFSKNTTKTL